MVSFVRLSGQFCKIARSVLQGYFTWLKVTEENSSINPTTSFWSSSAGITSSWMPVLDTIQHVKLQKYLWLNSTENLWKFRTVNLWKNCWAFWGEQCEVRSPFATLLNIHMHSEKNGAISTRYKPENYGGTWENLWKVSFVKMRAVSNADIL